MVAWPYLQLQVHSYEPAGCGSKGQAGSKHSNSAAGSDKVKLLFLSASWVPARMGNGKGTPWHGYGDGVGMVVD